MRRALPLISALAVPVASAQTAVPEHLKATRTLDFSLPPAMGYAQHGYRVYGPENEWLMFDPPSSSSPDNGGMCLRLGSSGAPVTIEHADGTEFDVLSMDVAEYSRYFMPIVVSFRGTKADGTTLDFDFRPDHVIDGTGPLVDFEHVAFPPEWTGLVRCQVTTPGAALDNIVLRGLASANDSSREERPLPLEVLGMLSGGLYDTWGVTGVEGDRVYLRQQLYPSDPLYLSAFSMSAGKIVQTVSISGNVGGNLETGETAYATGGELVWRQGELSRTLATVGENGVTGIAYPRPSGGRVLFANHWYQGAEKFAVFMAGTEGVTPILTPATVLPDGGTPYSFPYELHFNGSSYAISTSTTKSGSLWVISFAGGPLRLSPGHGQLIPGTNFQILDRPTLSWLRNDSAGFVANTMGTGGGSYNLVMFPDGTWEASPVDSPALGRMTTLPGWGYMQRDAYAVTTAPGSVPLTYGPIECHDLGPNNRHGLVAWPEGGGAQLMIREGTTHEGFGTIKQIHATAHAADGMFYVTARNTAGEVGLLRGRIPTGTPQLRAGVFQPTADGTVRFLAENLTHGRSYIVKRSSTLEGPWTTASRFTAGSPVRSVLGGFSYETRGFFRVVEVE